MPLGDESEFQRLQTTLTVMSAKFDYMQSDLAQMKEQVMAFSGVPGLVAGLARDVERIQRQVEMDRRQPAQAPVGATATLLVMVAISAAILFAAVFLGGRLGQ